ncbi:MAG: XRE family transcriptional regulator [Anaerococcus sp.]|nr:XRE family transcriptional regulator [Anaerococcus sp.]
MPSISFSKFLILSIFLNIVSFLDKLESLSSILKVDLIKKYFEIIYEDSRSISSLINSLNSKDRVNGSSQSSEIENLQKIKEKTTRSVLKSKCEKLILYFKSIELKDKDLRKDRLIRALNTGANFNLEDLNDNYYDDIDYRILMNYSLTLDDPKEKLRICKFIESRNLDDENLLAVLYQNISTFYFTLADDTKALFYIDKALCINTKNPPSPIMVYTKAMILEAIGQPFRECLNKALDLARESDPSLYKLLIDKLQYFS